MGVSVIRRPYLDADYAENKKKRDWIPACARMTRKE
jgi:hypothetical protein